MATKKTLKADDELALLFSDGDPFKKQSRRPTKRRDIGKEIRARKASTVDQASTWHLLRELYKRHSTTVYAVGFWLELAIIIYIKL